MSWQDRDYNQAGYGRGGAGGVLWSLFFGSVPLGTAFGIRVRVHAMFLWFAGLTILIDAQKGYPLGARVASMAILFGIVLLHEFGHCFACRRVGGTADDILMWPLGGLAFVSPPRRPLPTFITVAGGPAVNVAICLLAGAYLAFQPDVRQIPLNPFNVLRYRYDPASLTFYVWWTYYLSYYLLLFNLLPIYPFDGGQMLQAALWPKLGYYRSMLVAATTGMWGGGALALYGVWAGSFLLIIIALNGVLACWQLRAQLKAVGPEIADEGPSWDYGSSSLQTENATRRKVSEKLLKRVQKRQAEERAEQARVDAILEKVSQQGMHSLTWREKRALRKATERQRQRDLEVQRQRQQL